MFLLLEYISDSLTLEEVEAGLCSLAVSPRMLTKKHKKIDNVKILTSSPFTGESVLFSFW